MPGHRNVLPLRSGSRNREKPKSRLELLENEQVNVARCFKESVEPGFGIAPQSHSELMLLYNRKVNHPELGPNRVLSIQPHP